MEIKKRSTFKNPEKDLQWFRQWIVDLEKLIIDYEVFALTRYQDNTQKPYYMAEQLEQVKTDTYLLEGDQDLLFPFEKSIQNAQAKLSNLKAIKVFSNVGHGIETYAEAMQYIGDTIKGDTSI